MLNFGVTQLFSGLSADSLSLSDALTGIQAIPYAFLMAARLILSQEAAGSTPAAPAVAVADMAMHRIVAPDHAGSTPASHPAPWCNGSTQGFDPCSAGSSPAGAVLLSHFAAVAQWMGHMAMSVAFDD